MNSVNVIIKRIVYITIITFAIIMTLCACGIQSQSVSKSNVDFSTLTKTCSKNIQYATFFTIDEYGEYDLITIGGENTQDVHYLTVPKGADVPMNLPENTYVLQKPFDKTYLVSTSVMDLIVKADALENIRLSGTKQSDWFIDEAVDAMENGDILYAGKYSAPDYELILSEKCNFVIENTMIYHNPEVKEKLEELGLPVLVELSSYEKHPLGRLEWIKLYGCLFDKEELTDEYFDNQLSKIEGVINKDKTGKTIAFFYITSNGSVNVRKNNDYIAQMIELSGGIYALKDVMPDEENALSTMNMQMEEFYSSAVDADILIYNSTIDGEIGSIDEMLSKSSLLKDFKAVKEKNVYCTSKNFFQETTGMAEFMEDLNNIMNDKNDNLYYLNRLE